MAGNLYYPLLDSGMPEIRYVRGDSVSVTIAEASEASDFKYLTGNRAREANGFYHFVPELPEPKTESGFIIIPALAIQVTLFPETAYVWSCLVKSAMKSWENVDENEPEYFAFAVDARHRLEPPVPAAYFGNCAAFAVVESRHGILSGKDGFFIAAELVGDLIGKKDCILWLISKNNSAVVR
ncbi:hypothetical protein BUALT_Bualt01G0214000 [Buddleja alternifolia]|uniref:Uncharacterized protein n=1 Tax=Buddleja alternifolia TaxID=168488 RepID=A0AAV6YJT2_9LAMI|nr:hypothetical protein BUALT_Bualt01G0214000 [Buddleja alternifolia]